MFWLINPLFLFVDETRQELSYLNVDLCDTLHVVLLPSPYLRVVESIRT